MTNKTPWPTLRRNLVAILRGIKPEEAVECGQAIFEAGIQAIEVPLNSPDPFTSIERLASTLPDTALIGAGTVVTTADVERLNDVGGKLMVSPNVDLAVLERATSFGMVTMPGVFTATEAFQAISGGASALKFFPASVLGVSGISAIRAVLPSKTIIGAVGGVSESEFADFAAIGVRTFGLGSSLYKPGATVTSIGENAAIATAEWDRVFGQ